ncbi:glutamate synthase, partial [Staphylococcus sp. SIMBA_130]
MGKPTGFLDYPREKARERDLSTRLKDWGEYQLPQSEENLKTQGARCIDCGTPFCHSGIELNGSASGCPL